jgi:hypothetical protein
MSFHHLVYNLVFVKKEFLVNFKPWGSQSPYELNYLGRENTFFLWIVLPINADALEI